MNKRGFEDCEQLMAGEEEGDLLQQPLSTAITMWVGLCCNRKIGAFLDTTGALNYNNISYKLVYDLM